jgi:hypothetical protein
MLLGKSASETARYASAYAVESASSLVLFTAMSRALPEESSPKSNGVVPRITAAPGLEPTEIGEEYGDTTDVRSKVVQSNVARVIHFMQPVQLFECLASLLHTEASSSTSVDQ